MIAGTTLDVALSTNGEWPGVEGSLLLLAIIFLAGIGTGVLFLASVVAWSRRRTVKYGLITLAVGALFFRSIVCVGTVMGVIPMTIHHMLEHSFDFLIAALILYAVYRSAPTDSELDLGGE